MGKNLSKVELIDLVRIIMNSGDDEKTGKEYTEDEVHRMVIIFEENVPNPNGRDLIFYPVDCGLGDDPSAEEIVEAALNYSEDD